MDRESRARSYLGTEDVVGAKKKADLAPLEARTGSVAEVYPDNPELLSPLFSEGTLVLAVSSRLARNAPPHWPMAEDDISKLKKNLSANSPPQRSTVGPDLHLLKTSRRGIRAMCEEIGERLQAADAAVMQLAGAKQAARELCGAFSSHVVSWKAGGTAGIQGL